MFCSYQPSTTMACTEPWIIRIRRCHCHRVTGATWIMRRHHHRRCTTRTTATIMSCPIILWALCPMFINGTRMQSMGECRRHGSIPHFATQYHPNDKCCVSSRRIPFAQCARHYLHIVYWVINSHLKAIMIWQFVEECTKLCGVLSMIKSKLNFDVMRLFIVN